MIWNPKHRYFKRIRNVFKNQKTGAEWQEWGPGSHLRSYSCREIGTQAASACVLQRLLQLSVFTREIDCRPWLSSSASSWSEQHGSGSDLLHLEANVPERSQSGTRVLRIMTMQCSLITIVGHHLRVYIALFLTSLALVNNANDWDSDSVCQCQNIFHTHSVQNCQTLIWEILSQIRKKNIHVVSWSKEALIE